MKQLTTTLWVRFKKNTPLWSKIIIAFCLMVIPLLQQNVFGIDILDKYKGSMIISLSIISFMLKFLVPKEDKSGI